MPTNLIQPPPPIWYTPAEAAELMHCSTRTITRAIKDGSLPSFKFRGIRRIDSRVIDRLAARGSRAARPASEVKRGKRALASHVVDTRAEPAETATPTNIR